MWLGVGLSFLLFLLWFWGVLWWCFCPTQNRLNARGMGQRKKGRKNSGKIERVKDTAEKPKLWISFGETCVLIIKLPFLRPKEYNKRSTETTAAKQPKKKGEKMEWRSHD